MKNRLTEIFGTRTVLCDGAMGTSLYARGIFINRCYDELNLSQPELVRTVHEEYLQAGAEIIADKVIEINRAGVEIARKAVNLRAD
jgi:methionine synthase I (cobalamin-dependent)